MRPGASHATLAEVATYAIGDVQGCFHTLETLLARVAFDPRSDCAILVGDLVNRGPRSLEVLRWATGLGDRVQAVLGNHDLHLLARAAGLTAPRRRDTLDEVLGAPDCDDLLAWLRQRPFAVREAGHLVVHGGLFPSWSLSTAETLAAEAAEALRGEGGLELLAKLVAAPPLSWSDELRGEQRAICAIQGLTRLRVCYADGRPEPGFHGPPADAPPGTAPWFELREPARDDATIVFGHWAALGLHVGPRAVGIDTGCVWGRELTALRLEDGALFQVEARD